MKIRKFNESANMEEYEVVDENIQQIISHDLIEDYFSLLEHLCELEIDLYVVSKEENDEILYEDDVCYRDGYQIAWKIDLTQKITDDFYIDSGDNFNYYYVVDKSNNFIDIVSGLKSIKNKLESHNHSLFVCTGPLQCYVLNNENNK